MRARWIKVYDSFQLETMDELHIGSARKALRATLAWEAFAGNRFLGRFDTSEFAKSAVERAVGAEVDDA